MREVDSFHLLLLIFIINMEITGKLYFFGAHLLYSGENFWNKKGIKIQQAGLDS